MSDDGNFEIFLAIGFGFGLLSFFRGFRIYREYRILEDTPEIPIRSIAMGLVHIHGKAQGDQLIPSPVTQTPCFFYKVDIEKYQKDSKGNGSWRHYKTDVNGVRFHLEDATGKVLVDAHNAEYDLLETCKRKTGSTSGSGLFGGTNDPALTTGAFVTDSSLMSYAESVASAGGGSIAGTLAQFTLGSSLNLGGGGWGSGYSGQYRFSEYCILKGHWYDLTGTCVENPTPQDEHDRNLIMKGQNEPTYLISWRAEKAIEATLRNRAVLYIFGGGALAVACLGILLLRFGLF